MGLFVLFVILDELNTVYNVSKNSIAGLLKESYQNLI